MYEIGVDKSGLPVGGREEIRHIQAAENRRKKTLASAAGFCKSGIVTSLLLQPGFWKARFGGFFFFRSSGFLRSLRGTGQNRKADTESARISFTQQA